MRLNTLVWLAGSTALVVVATGCSAATSQHGPGGPMEGRSEEDRPPIIVQDGSIKFEIEKDPNTGTAKAKWAEKNSSDKTRFSALQEKGRHSKAFLLTSDLAGCGPFIGTTATVDFDYVETSVPRFYRFWILLEGDKNNKHEPVVESPVELTPAGDYEVAIPTAGQLTRVAVSGGSLSGSCLFTDTTPGTPKLRFRFLHK